MIECKMQPKLTLAPKKKDENIQMKLDQVQKIEDQILEELKIVGSIIDIFY